MDNAPERIWAQARRGIWRDPVASDSVMMGGTQYLRADLAAKEVDKLLAEVDRLWEALRQWVNARSTATQDPSPETFATLANAESVLAAALQSSAGKVAD
jgi:hypothetical protein